jgi:uracil-DNA glycosylase
MSFPAAVTRACGELPPRLGVTRLPAAGQERPMPEKTQLDLELSPAINSLSELAKAENECTRCPLYKHATQAVPGEGRRSAHVMLVGEQPGDKEDLAGKPFVGPAGRVLDRALADAGIPRTEVFVTNAVKHFKHEMRGKRRLHKRPNTYEIERCKIWLDVERSLVAPSTIVALGATAARSLTGRALTIGKMRGKPLQMADGTTLVITVHPSSLLRIEDDKERHAAYRGFVADLKAAAAARHARGDGKP